MKSKIVCLVLRATTYAAAAVASLGPPALARSAAVPAETLRVRDLASLWRSGQYFPLAYTRKAVEGVTERVIRLVPAR